MIIDTNGHILIRKIDNLHFKQNFYSLGLYIFRYYIAMNDIRADAVKTKKFLIGKKLYIFSINQSDTNKKYVYVNTKLHF